MMFSVAILSLFALVSAQNAVTEGPACDVSERYQCNGQIGLIASTTDCHVFYNCDRNIQTPCPSTCSPGLAFDESIQTCNWESLVPTCNLIPKARASGDPACADNERYQCNGQIGLIASTTDCHVFFNCDANIQAPCPSTCPPGLAFDESIQTCNWESVVPTCTARARAVDGPACADNERYQCNGQIGLIASTTDCHVFYNCDSNIQAPCPSTCSPGLAFDESIQTCNWESLVPTCTARARAVDGPACADNERYQCNGQIGLIASTTDCHVFYNCDANIQAPCPSTCSPGLAFDESIQTCNWESLVPTCTARARAIDGPACADNERYDCNGATSAVVDSTDCNTFYNCDANIQSPCPSHCPAGLGFDEALGYCNYPYLVAAC